MTDLTAPIIFNNSTGSDTTASGSAGSGASCSGTGASTTAASATVDLSADTPISGFGTVAAGDLFWIDSSSGRQFSVIASVVTTGGSESVTCDDVFDNTESARNWGIGGKRRTLDDAGSRALFRDDYPGGCEIQIEETGTDYTLTNTSLEFFPSGKQVTINGTGSTRPIIRQTANDEILHFLNNGSTIQVLFFSYLAFQCSGVADEAYQIQGNHNLSFKNCVFGDATNQLTSVVTGGYGVNTWAAQIFIDCEIKETTGDGIAPARTMRMYGCYIHDCGGAGIDMGTNGLEPLHLADCVIVENAGSGVEWNSGLALIERCVIAKNGNHGINVQKPSGYANGVIFNNSITANGGYGITANVGVIERMVFGGNNFGGGSDTYGKPNTSGGINNEPTSTVWNHFNQGNNAREVIYTDPVNGDWSIDQAQAGTGFPDSSRNIGGNPINGTKTFIDPGVQRQEPQGGGGILQGLHSINTGITA